MSGSLPGDPSPDRRVAEAIRVDHAGEYAAARIYEGQLAVLGRGEAGDTLRHMLGQERAHLATFTALIAERRIRPTVLLPVWHLAAYALGAATAALGPRAAMACTVAVEDAIDQHYAAQAAALPADEAALAATVQTFRGQELEHRDTAIAQGAEQAPFYRAMTAVIRTGCLAAIKLSEKL